MIDFINQHEPVLRALVFASSLGLLAVFEVLFPRRLPGFLSGGIRPRAVPPGLWMRLLAWDFLVAY